MFERTGKCPIKDQPSNGRSLSLINGGLDCLLVSLIVVVFSAATDASMATVRQEVDGIPADTYDLTGECFERTDTGKSMLADVELRLYLVDYARMNQTLIGSTNSDMAGEFVFPGLVVPDEQQLVHPMYVVLARRSGYATHRVREEIWRSNENQLQVAMTPAGSLTGRAHSPDGDPIAGVTIYDGTFLVEPVFGFRCVKTDANGVFELTDVSRDLPAPHNRFDNISLLGSHPGFGKFRMTIADTSKPVQIPLFPASPVKGRVLNEQTGQPAADVNVVATPVNQKRRGLQLPGIRIQAMSWLAGRTDESGEYQLNVFPNTKYNVFVVDTPEQAPAQTVATEPSKTVKLEDFRLIPTVPVSGQVFDAQSGKPIRNPVQVFWQGPARPTTGSPVQRVTTQSNGKFVLNMIPGRNFPFVTYSDGEFLWRSADVLVNGKSIGKNGFVVDPDQTAELKILVEFGRLRILEN